MYDIYATDMVFEQCAKDKSEINMVIPYAVFHFVLSGEGYVNGKKVSSNMVFISFEENHMHYYPSRINPWHYIYFRVKGADIKKAFIEHGFHLDLTICPFENQEALFKVLALHEEFLDINNSDAQKIIANALFLLFEERNQTLLHKSKPQQHVDQIKQYIEENYYKRITLEEVASSFYLNKNYIRTLFVQQLGISPKQYLQKIRFERAKFLLSFPEKSIKLIANSVGYEDPLLFSKMFKQYYKCSPMQYRVSVIKEKKQEAF